MQLPERFEYSHHPWSDDSVIIKAGLLNNVGEQCAQMIVKHKGAGCLLSYIFFMLFAKMNAF